MQAVEQAKAAGVRVSAEVTPHHLTLTDDVVRTLDSRFKMNPPLRSEGDRRALVEALRSGVIDCVATDHAPHARHEKEVPFEQAAMGTTGLETAFAALFTELVLPGRAGARGGGRADERRRRRSTVCRLPRIAPDEPANLVVVDLDASFEVGAHGYVSRSENSCFHGRRLHGRVRADLAAGAVAFRERMLVEAAASTAERADALPTSCSRTARDSTAWPAAPTATAVGEIVFTTSMSGYQEAMTDPSYAGQLITFTFPQVGNYGVRAEAMESDRDPRPRGDHAGGGRSRAGPGPSGLADLAGRRRDPGDHRRRHASAGAPHPRPGGDARRRVPGELARGRGADADRWPSRR